MNVPESNYGYYTEHTDAQLIKLANQYLNTLPESEIVAFYDEVESRQLELSESITEHQKKIDQFNFNLLPKHIIQFITDSKSNQKSNSFILNGLTERGIEENTGYIILGKMYDYFDEMSQKNADLIFSGLPMLVGGIAINVLPISKNQHLAIIVIAYCLIVVGVVRMLHGYSNKRRYERMGKSQRENENESES
jgi:hypothetical protein